jgi:formyl-CoA transferase
VFTDPQVLHRRMQVSAPHPAAGEVRMVANPIKFSRSTIPHDVAPPLLGQHTDEVLGSVLGMDAETIVGLRKDGVV